MEEFYTELMMNEIRRTDPEFYEYIRNEIDHGGFPDDDDAGDYDGDDAA